MRTSLLFSSAVMFCVFSLCGVNASAQNESRKASQDYIDGMAMIEDPEKQEEAVALLERYLETVRRNAQRSDVIYLLLDHYLQISRRNTERAEEIYPLLAKYYMKNINKFTSDYEKMGRIHDYMQKTLETNANDAELKEAMAKAYTAMRRYVHAAKLYKELHNEFPNRPEYLYSAAENFIAANQMDDAQVSLVKLTNIHSSYIPGHLLYATFWEQVMGKPDSAETIMDDMVEANLQSAAAYARRSIYRLEHKNPDGAKDDLDKALDIDPDWDCVDTLVAAANYYLYKKEYLKTRAYLDSVPPASRANDDVSSLRVRLADAEGKPEEAIAVLREKLAKKDNFILRVMLFDRLVATRNLDEARAEIAHLKKMRMSMEIIGFFESAIDIVEENWYSAIRKLELARGLFTSHPQTVAYVDRQLALCYGKLGQTDKQLDAFQRAIENTPVEEVVPISIAYIYALNTAGKTERLKEAMRDLEMKIGTEAMKEIPQLQTIKTALEEL